MIHTSVIIPVYNSAAYLDDCLRSVLRQDDGGIEILLVDDGSADESPAILRRWAAADSRVRVLRQEHGMQGRARNLGIAQARGDYICFLDSDDLLAEDAVARCHEAAVSAGCDFVTFDARLTDPSGAEVSHPHYSRAGIVSEALFSGPLFWKLYFLAEKVPFTCWSLYIKRSFLLGHDLFFGEGMLYEDNDWVLRAFLYARRIRYIPAKLYIYRQRPDSSVNRPFERIHLTSNIRLVSRLLALYTGVDSRECHDMVTEMLGPVLYNLERLTSPGPDLHADLLYETLRKVTVWAETASPPVCRETAFRTACRIRCSVPADCAERVALRAACADVVRTCLTRPGRHSRIVIYGTGTMTRRFLEAFLPDRERFPAELTFAQTVPDASSYLDRPLVRAAQIDSCRPDAVVITSSRYREEMRAYLHRTLCRRIPVYIYTGDRT